MRASALVLLCGACAVVPDSMLPEKCADQAEDPFAPGDENCDGVEDVDASVLEAWRPDALGANEVFVDLFTYDTADGEVIALVTSGRMLGLRFVERTVEACVSSTSILRGAGGFNFVALAVAGPNPTANDSLVVVGTVPLDSDCGGIDPSLDTQSMVAAVRVDELAASGDLLAAQSGEQPPQLLAWTIGASFDVVSLGPACRSGAPARALVATPASQSDPPDLIRVGPVDLPQDALELFLAPKIDQPGLGMCSVFPAVASSVPVEASTEVLAAAPDRVIAGSPVELWEVPWTELWADGLPDTPTWTGPAVDRVLPLDGGMVLLHTDGGATRIRGGEHTRLLSDRPLMDAVVVDGDVILALDDGTLLRWP